MDYKNGKIYRLVCNVSGKQYIGSTTRTLSKRKNDHKAKYNAWIQSKDHFITSFKIIEGGDYSIFLIEEYPCESKDQLNSRERYWIETMDCVNKNIPTRPNSEWREANIENIKKQRQEYAKKNFDKEAERKKKHYEDHKEQYLERVKNWVEENKDLVKARQKQYYVDNKEKLKQQQKTWYEKNKEKILARMREKITCQECGKEMSRGNQSKHRCQN